MDSMVVSCGMAYCLIGFFLVVLARVRYSESILLKSNSDPASSLFHPQGVHTYLVWAEG